MKRGENEIVVDLRGLELSGEILDMGFEGMGAIYRALKGKIIHDDHFETAASIDASADIEDCNWVYGNPTELPFKENSFDAVTAFFSISLIKRKHMRNKSIKEIARSLKVGGKLYIWDICANFRWGKPERTVRALLNGGEEVKLCLSSFRIPWYFNLYSLVPVVSRYFTIIEKRDRGDHFYIEAVKKDDAT